MSKKLLGLLSITIIAMGLILLAVGASPAAADAPPETFPAEIWLPDGSGPEGSAFAAREQVLVDSVADLLENIGRDDVEIYLAPQSTDEGGRYVIPACPPEVDEYADPTCGVLIQGNNAVLESSLDLAQDEQGVPYPDAELLSQGAVIDCSELPFGPNQLLASCLIPGDGSVIRKLTIDGSAAGGEPAEMLGEEKRNAITIQGTSSRVEEVVFRNVRRGVLNVSWFLDGASTSASVTSSHFTNIELAATFGFIILSTDHRLDYAIRANYFGIGVFTPILFEWTHGETFDNETHMDVVDNVILVQNPWRPGIVILQSVGWTDTEGNEGEIRIRGGRIQGVAPEGECFDQVGIAILSQFDDSEDPHYSRDNHLKVEITDVAFENLEGLVGVYYDGLGAFAEGNSAILELEGLDASGNCGDRVEFADSGQNDVSIRGTLRSFEDNNPGIDATELDGQFTGH
jgi:hypothetical protein